MRGFQVKPILALALASFVISQVLADNTIDFNNPVRTAEEDEIKNLPGLDFELKFKQYSGYLEADDKKNRFWHYWFVESQSDPSKDPLVLWLNGGPGCSSLLGLLTELGPLRVADNGTLYQNPYAWNKNANIIFMESPAGVGFSYSVDGNVEANDDTTADQNHHALASFLKKFPQYKDRPLYLTGESYGGVYLPTLSVLVDADPSMNLKGVAIGNGYLDANKLAESLIYFCYYHGLLGKETWAQLSQECCDGKPPARGDCKFIDPNRSKACGDLMVNVSDGILNSGINPYNLYDKCVQPSSSPDNEIVHSRRRGFGNDEFDRLALVRGREHFDKNLVFAAFNVTSSKKSKQSYSRIWSRSQKSVGSDPPCTSDATVINYLNKPETRDALNIPRDLKTPFTTCFDGIQYTMIYPGRIGGLAPQMNKLIASKRNLTMLVYNGDVDLMCNFFGDEWFVDDLNREVTHDYSAWFTNNQVSGFVKQYKGITYMTVKGSGHMVPTDKPAEALHMFEMFLSGMLV